MNYLLFTCVWAAVQIIAESFPISSSGHVALLEQFFFSSPISVPAVVHDLIHLPTLIIVALAYRREWFFYLKYLHRVWRFAIRVGLLALCAVVPTVCFYLFFRYEPHATCLPVEVGFVISALALLALPRYKRDRAVMAPWASIIILGCVQGVALLPGISRMGVTFVAARWLGWRAERALEVSLLIQCPLLCAAVARGLIHLVRTDDAGMLSWSGVSVVVVCVAAGVAYPSLQYTRRLLSSDCVRGFAWYLVVLTLISGVLRLGSAMQYGNM